MTLKIGFTDELTNTQYAPLAVLLYLYQQQSVFAPVEEVHLPIREREFRTSEKLVQVLVSILSGCETLSEVNVRLKAERGLAQVLGWKRFADQSNLSRTLDELEGQSIQQLRQATAAIWRRFSRVARHSYHSKLWLDYDLSGLPCGPQAQASQRGYFSGKKLHRAAVGAGECDQLPRDALVGDLSRQSQYRPMFGTGRVGHRGPLSPDRRTAQTDSLAPRWGEW